MKLTLSQPENGLLFQFFVQGIATLNSPAVFVFGSSRFVSFNHPSTPTGESNSRCDNGRGMSAVLKGAEGDNDRSSHPNHKKLPDERFESDALHRFTAGQGTPRGNEMVDSKTTANEEDTMEKDRVVPRNLLDIPLDSKPSTPRIKSDTNSIWRVSWRNDVEIWSSPFKNAQREFLGYLRRDSFIEEIMCEGDWMKHSKGWSLVRDKTRARVNLRKSSKRDVEVAIILQQFDEIVTGWRIILRRSKEKAHYANMLLGAREHFVRQLAIIGSHSKVSEKRTSKVAQQSFHTRYLEQVVRRLERIEESRKRILNLEMSTLKARRAYEISEEQLGRYVFQRDAMASEFLSFKSKTVFSQLSDSMDPWFCCIDV
mmetsp:Transcript_25415/g.40951  ORF Transcript_25415/g.40951 Transcript_25415/m.40951 type:complete len:370 (+) Transcript_25415:3566-4675(+)